MFDAQELGFTLGKKSGSIIVLDIVLTWLVKWIRKKLK